MPEKKVKNPPATNIKKTEPAVPSRTAADSLGLMFRRGINGSHNKGKTKLISTGERITRDEFLSVGGDFVTIFDHNLRKELEPIVEIIKTEANPKLDRFYCTEEMLNPSYVPTPFVPKPKVKAPVEAAAVKKPVVRKAKVAEPAPAKKGKKTPAAAAVEVHTPAPAPAPVPEKKKRGEKQAKK